MAKAARIKWKGYLILVSELPVYILPALGVFCQVSIMFQSETLMRKVSTQIRSPGPGHYYDLSKYPCGLGLVGSCLLVWWDTRVWPITSQVLSCWPVYSAVLSSMLENKTTLAGAPQWGSCSLPRTESFVCWVVSVCVCFLFLSLAFWKVFLRGSKNTGYVEHGIY